MEYIGISLTNTSSSWSSSNMVFNTESGSV
ncbi:Uncharacterised protein [Mycobacterium tuberculosis]|uniref:Uncharacterized protein n=1 Tax=Mycobacterium tuberculosis TaxID=1773 RepID=A0A916LG95_MYCTX|nr:Uncharacterised protein [Mycobacterium tuberculosis]CKR72091.1 Uncharacterised protein [Mycobacterium tuberculosis]CPA61014.1 Uncharacterised protein [Mycobacterium tuberculosis]CPA77521.1 Uncharacterised protein [Mycobacterium tuberculosis]